jgi:ethanolaminephosphotransferase
LTFDSLDGKLARKYNNFSKIGEFLDHGGDALSDNFMAIIITQSLSLNNKYEKALILISFQVVDFCMLWEQNVTSLYHPFRDQIGLSENVLFCIFILLSRIFFSKNFIFYLGRFTLIFYAYMYLTFNYLGFSVL